MKKLIFLLALVISPSVSAAFLTADAIKQVRPGMSEQQVRSIVGEPDGFAVREGHLILTWNDCFISAFSPDKTDFFVVLKDDKVMEVGKGEVRKHNPGATNALGMWLLKRR